MAERRKRISKTSVNGHGNGIAHVPEETSGDERSWLDASTPLLAKELKRKEKGTPKVDWEIPRKTLHSSIGFLTLALYVNDYDAWPVVKILSGTLVFVTVNEFIRLRSSRFERLYEKAVGFLMRESEKGQINGVVWYLIGVLFVLVVFPLDIAVVSILILSWADTAASTFGRMYGSRTPKLPTTSIPLPTPFVPVSRWPRLGFAARKSTAGFLASSVTGVIITSSFWGYFSRWRSVPPLVSFGSGACARGQWSLGLVGLSAIVGLASGVIEAFDFGSLDDNLTLPILSGSTLWLLHQIIC